MEGNLIEAAVFVIRLKWRASMPELKAIGRRSFIEWLAANSAMLAAGERGGSTSGAASQGPPYYVGAGHSTDPYTAASVALAACGQFPNHLAGRTVVIKPNLVIGAPASSGTTTDPHVVQAAVDLALASGATQILIVEAAPPGFPSFFDACGYTAIFQSYPQVQLIDLRSGSYVLTPVPGGGYAYQSMWIPSLLLEPSTFFISAGKMKTHYEATATLSMKNLVGLGSETSYGLAGTKLARDDLHNRGIAQSIMDLNLLVPIRFSLIDGIWGMEGQGPVNGDPVRVNVVLAGLNPVAVDRVGLDVMMIPQTAVSYLTYAARAGLGPPNTNNVTVLGDAFTPYPFVPAQTPPILWQPVASPASIAPGQTTTIQYRIPSTCFTIAEIIQDSDETPGVVTVRTLHGLKQVAAPGESVNWNGKDSSGTPVAPGTYLARIRARASATTATTSYAVGRITVTG
jgi:uncharacterized protein (DUF362 family)